MRERESFGWFILGFPSAWMLAVAMECRCPRRGGHETVALPAKSLEITLAKTKEVQKRVLEMAMPALQRKRFERLDTYGVWWKVSYQAPEAPQNLPARVQAEAQDAVMQIGNPCLMEHTRQSERYQCRKQLR